METAQTVWGSIRGWFAGKKQILGGGVIVLAAIAGAVTGKLSLVDAATVAGAGLAICGHAAKSDRQHAQIIQALTAAATAGVDLRLGNKAGAFEALKPVAIEGVSMAATELAPLAIHVSGEPAEVLAAVTALTANAPGGATAGPTLVQPQWGGQV